MEKIFIDSDYVIDYLRGKNYTKPFIEKIRNKQLLAHISVVTLFELYTGAFLSENSKRKFEDIQYLLNWFEVVDITKEVMLVAARVHTDLQKRGLMIGIQDIFIAASAMSMNTKLITNNKKHFQNIRELRLA